MEKKKIVYQIITDYWNSIKEHIEKLPSSDAEWDEFVKANAALTIKYQSKGTEAERQFARDLSLACLNYMQNRSKEDGR